MKYILPQKKSSYDFLIIASLVQLQSRTVILVSLDILRSEIPGSHKTQSYMLFVMHVEQISHKLEQFC